MEIIGFGPFVAFGFNYIGKNEEGEIPQLWTEKLLPRMATGGPCFGVCRCVPGMMDGTFEYIAGVSGSGGGVGPGRNGRSGDSERPVRRHESEPPVGNPHGMGIRCR